MIYGIGTDILKISRLTAGLDEAFRRKVYTEQELAQADKTPDPAVSLAARFCAKEAVFKAISACRAEFCPREIAILEDPYGKPYAEISGRTAAQLGKCWIFVSISFEDEYAISDAIAEDRQGAKDGHTDRGI